jgi:hypothetical protein
VVEAYLVCLVFEECLEVMLVVGLVELEHD